MRCNLRRLVHIGNHEWQMCRFGLSSACSSRRLSARNRRETYWSGLTSAATGSEHSGVARFNSKGVVAACGGFDATPSALMNLWGDFPG